MEIIHLLFIYLCTYLFIYSFIHSHFYFFHGDHLFYQGVRNVSFAEYFANVIIEYPLGS